MSGGEKRDDESAIRARLAKYYSPAEIETWLSSEHPLLGDEAANDLIARGEAGKVIQVLEQLESGAYL